VGESIVYNPTTLDLQFEMVNSREDLHNNLASAPRVRVVHKGIRPDTLVNEATAIATGKLDNNGNFVLNNAPDSLLLQCPTKYEDAAKAQASR
jgi:cytochrome c-type biogenesis protein CcmE